VALCAERLSAPKKVYDYFCLWGYDGTLKRTYQVLYEACPTQAECAREPTLDIIASQSVKSVEKKGLRIDPHIYDTGKKIKG
jgi:putative transposase